MNIDKNLKYVAFDPGIATGVAAWNSEFAIVRLEILRGFDTLDKFLDELEAQVPPPEVIIYEKYRVGYSYGGLIAGKYGRIHGGKDVLTEQAIGSILRTARKIKANIVSQEPSILPLAQLHSGVRIRDNHTNSHHEAAYNHGYEWLLKQGFVKPRVLKSKGR